MEFDRLKKENIWLFLNTFSYISIKSNEAFLYNTLNGDNIIEKRQKIINKIKGLSDYQNRYVIEIDKKDIDDDLYSLLIEVRTKFLGDFYPKSLSHAKPVQFYPNPVIHYEFEEYIPKAYKKFAILVDDHISDYLNTLVLQLTNHCQLNCEMCKTAYRQFTCCSKAKNKSAISIETVNELLIELKTNFRKQILKIIGGNIFSHPDFPDIVRELTHSGHQIHYYAHYQNIADFSNKDVIKGMMKNNNRLFVQTDLPVNIEVFSRIIEKLMDFLPSIHYDFIIQSEEQLVQMEDLINRFQLENVRLHPFYNEYNTEFFKESVFIKEEFLRENVIGMEEIKANMEINSTKIKHLSISSTGEVFTSFNHGVLGELGKMSLSDMVRKAFGKLNSAWRQTRKDFKICKDCTRQFVCPPISDLENFCQFPSMCWRSI